MQTETGTPPIPAASAATPPVVNDPERTLRAKESLRKVVPGQLVSRNADQLGGEDFSFYEQTGVPGLFIRYGVADDTEGSRRPLHNGQFCPSEQAIPLAASIYAQVALDYLNGLI